MYRKILSLCFVFLLISCESEVKKPIGRTEEIDRLYQSYRHSFKNTSEISSSDLSKSMHKVTLVDVRSDKEMAVSKIIGAISQLEFEQQKVVDKKKDIVVYCTIGYRSGLFCQSLEKKGYRAFNLKGGILSWVHEGHSVTQEGKPVFEVHVYGEKWNLLPDKYKGVW